MAFTLALSMTLFQREIDYRVPLSIFILFAMTAPYGWFKFYKYLTERYAHNQLFKCLNISFSYLTGQITEQSYKDGKKDGKWTKYYKDVEINMRNTIDGECISRVSSYNILKVEI